MEPAPANNADQPLPPTASASATAPSESIASESTHVEPLQQDSPQQDSTTSSVVVARSKWGRKWALLLVASLLVIYMIIVPTIDYVISSFREPQSGRVLTDMTIAEKIRLHSVTGIVMLTFLALGGTIGSFLNVVIYRTPRRKPLLWPPSSCASCGTRIHGRDNIPVLGWLLLSGRCRTCGAAISARYPIIEAVIATVFIALYYIELLSGGDNIPVRMPNQYRGIVWILLYTKWDLVGLYFYHCLMLSLVLSVAMMNFDGFRAPRGFVITLLVGFGLLSISFPALHPVPAPYVPAYLTCLVGFGVGGLVGSGLQWLFPVARGAVTHGIVTLDTVSCESVNRDAVAESQVTADSQATVETRIFLTDHSILAADVQAAQLQVVGDQAGPQTPEPSPALPQPSPSRYGDRAAAPTSIADAAFVMALMGVTLGPQAVISMTLLLVPFLLLRLLSSIASIQRVAWTRTIPITLVLFVVAFAHQLLWAQIHRLLGFSG